MSALISILASASSVEADVGQQTLTSAVLLIKSTMAPGLGVRGQQNQDGRQIRMILALRRLMDPQLMPYFSHLSESSDPVLRVHGLLGLGQVSDLGRLDLIRLSKIDSPWLARQVVSLALDEKLLIQEDIDQLLAWPALDASVKVVLLTHQLKAHQPIDLAWLERSSHDKKVGLSSIADLLLLQSGKSTALASLVKLLDSEDEHRDLVVYQLLQIAFKSEFQQAGPWALQVAKRDVLEDSLRRLGLLVALRYQTPGAADYFLKWYRHSDDAVAQHRLAGMAINVAHWAEPSIFEVLIGSENSLLHQIGLTCQAVSKKQNILPATIALLGFNYKIVDQWALDYAKTLADDALAGPMLHQLILLLDTHPAHLSGRIPKAISATTAMADRYPQYASDVLSALLNDDQMPIILKHSILLGLARCQEVDPTPLIARCSFKQPLARQLALLITAINGHPLDASELGQLALLVRGGGRLSQSIRVQAAWAYLKMTHQTDIALTQVLGTP